MTGHQFATSHVDVTQLQIHLIFLNSLKPQGGHSSNDCTHGGETGL